MDAASKPTVEWKRMVCVMPQSAKKEEKKTNASQDSSQISSPFIR